MKEVKLNFTSEPKQNRGSLRNQDLPPEKVLAGYRLLHILHILHTWVVDIDPVEVFDGIHVEKFAFRLSEDTYE